MRVYIEGMGRKHQNSCCTAWELINGVWMAIIIDYLDRFAHSHKGIFGGRDHTRTRIRGTPKLHFLFVRSAQIHYE
jgi:hypothetical protein